MPRYYLANPFHATDVLIRTGQAKDDPIYAGSVHSDFFILKWCEDWKRRLFPFDPKTGLITGDPVIVPEDWSGDPRVVGIDADVWANLQSLAMHDPSARQVLRKLTGDLIEGDIIRITSGCATIGHIRAVFANGTWTLEKAS